MASRRRRRVIALRPAYATRCSGSRCRRTSSASGSSGSASPSTSDWTWRRPSWRARDVRRDIDVVEEVGALPARGRAGDAARRQAMFGRLTHFQRLRRLVEDVLVGAGLLRGVHLLAAARRSRPERARAACAAHARSSGCCARRSASACSARRAQRRRGERRRRALRGRARLPAGRRAVAAMERWHLGGIVRGRPLPGEGRRSRRSSRRCTSSRSSSAPRSRRARRSARGCSRGWVGAARPVGSSSTASGARSSSISRSSSRSCPSAILYRDVITYPPLRQDLAFVVDEDVPAGDLLAAAREAAGDGAARGAVPQ